MTDDWFSIPPCLGQRLYRGSRILLRTPFMGAVMKAEKVKMPFTAAEASWEDLRPF